MTAPSAEPVVVGVDGSDPALNAVRWAAHTAALRDAPLEAVHAMSSGWDLGDRLGVFTLNHPGFREAGEKALAQAEAVALTETAQHPVTVRTLLVSPSPISALRRRARHAQLLVVGARGLGAFERTLLGSVSGALARHPTCPLAIIPTEQAPASRDLPVLVGVDGSPGSHRAVAFAIEEAARRAVGLTAVTVWTDSPPTRRGDPAEHAHRLLADGLAGHEERFPDVAITRIVAEDDPARRLLYESAGTQLVVLGNRSRHGHGSVARTVLHAARVPLVLLDRRPDRVVADHDKSRGHRTANP